MSEGQLVLTSDAYPTNGVSNSTEVSKKTLYPSSCWSRFLTPMPAGRWEVGDWLAELRIRLQIFDELAAKQPEAEQEAMKFSLYTLLCGCLSEDALSDLTDRGLDFKVDSLLTFLERYGPSQLAYFNYVTSLRLRKGEDVLAFIRRHRLLTMRITKFPEEPLRFALLASLPMMYRMHMRSMKDKTLAEVYRSLIGLAREEGEIREYQKFHTEEEHRNNRVAACNWEDELYDDSGCGFVARSETPVGQHYEISSPRQTRKQKAQRGQRLSNNRR